MRGGRIVWMVTAAMAASLLAVPAGASDPGHAEPAGSPIVRLLAPPGAEDTGEASTDHLFIEDSRYPYFMPRATEDRPDERTGRQVHVVYLVPNGVQDQSLDELGVLHDSVLAQNHWFREETGLQWKLDTFTFEWDDPETFEEDPITIEAVDVSFVRANIATNSQLAPVRSALIAAGFMDPNKRYLVYAETSTGGVCGSAYYPSDAPTDPDDVEQYSAVYLNSSSGCRARDFASDPTSPSWSETIAQQEILHNDGLVPLVAPHTCWVGFGPAYGHVCTNGLPATGVVGVDVDPERFDVLFPYVGVPLNEKQVDIGDDDYFQHPFPYRALEDSPLVEPAPAPE